MLPESPFSIGLDLDFVSFKSYGSSSLGVLDLNTVESGVLAVGI